MKRDEIKDELEAHMDENPFERRSMDGFRTSQNTNSIIWE